MKKITYLLITMLLTTGLALAKDFELTKKADDYTVKVKIERTPLSGENNVTSRLKMLQARMSPMPRLKWNTACRPCRGCRP